LFPGISSACIAMWSVALCLSYAEHTEELLGAERPQPENIVNNQGETPAEEGALKARLSLQSVLWREFQGQGGRRQICSLWMPRLPGHPVLGLEGIAASRKPLLEVAASFPQRWGGHGYFHSILQFLSFCSVTVWLLSLKCVPFCLFLTVLWGKRRLTYCVSSPTPWQMLEIISL
jgi:hypothetical protein